MSISWKSYMAVSKIDTRGYLNARKIMSYEELLNSINPADVKPPLRHEVCPSWYWLSTAEPIDSDEAKARYTNKQISTARAKIKPIEKGPSDKEIAKKVEKIIKKVSKSKPKSTTAKNSNQSQDITKRTASRKTRSTKKE